jgi:hypothetical protein
VEQDVLELFNDALFFQMRVAATRAWALLVDVAMSQETGALSELVAAQGPAGAASTVGHLPSLHPAPLLSLRPRGLA